MAEVFAGQMHFLSPNNSVKAHKAPLKQWSL